MRSPCLGYWPPMLTVTDEQWIVLRTFEWATNCFFGTIIIHLIWLTYEKINVFVCLFVWSLSSHSYGGHYCRWRAINFDLCSAFMVIEQWGFLYATHLLWHGPSLFKYHLRGPVTHTPVAERLAVELSLPVFTTHVCHYWGSNPDIQHARRISTCEPPRRLITVDILPLPEQLFVFKSKKWYWQYIVCMLHP